MSDLRCPSHGSNTGLCCRSPCIGTIPLACLATAPLMGAICPSQCHSISPLTAGVACFTVITLSCVVCFTEHHPKVFSVWLSFHKPAVYQTSALPPCYLSEYYRYLIYLSCLNFTMCLFCPCNAGLPTCAVCLKVILPTCAVWIFVCACVICWALLCLLVLPVLGSFPIPVMSVWVLNSTVHTCDVCVSVE